MSGESRFTTLQRRLRLIAAIILLAGVCSAVLIYLTAGNAPDMVGYEPENSKKYIHDLELYGGKANVLASELMNWFAGLWYGKSLAFTVAVLSVLLSLGVFFVADHLLSGPESGSEEEHTRGRSG